MSRKHLSLVAAFVVPVALVGGVGFLAWVAATATPPRPLAFAAAPPPAEDDPLLATEVKVVRPLKIEARYEPTPEPKAAAIEPARPLVELTTECEEKARRVPIPRQGDKELDADYKKRAAAAHWRANRNLDETLECQRRQRLRLTGNED